MNTSKRVKWKLRENTQWKMTFRVMGLAEISSGMCVDTKKESSVGLNSAILRVKEK